MKQVFIRDFNLNFNLRVPKGERPTNIYLVTRLNGRQYKLSTGAKVYPVQWNSNKQMAYVNPKLSANDNNNNVIANNIIKELRNRFEEFIDYLCNHPNEMDDCQNLLKRYIYKDKMKTNSDIDVISWMKNSIKSKPIKEVSKERYLGHIKLFEEFLKSKKISPLKFADTNLSLMKNYETYLFNKVVNSKTGETMKTSVVSLKVETTINLIKDAAIDNLIDIHLAKLDEYKKPKIDKNYDNAIALSEEEINDMYNLPLTGLQEQVRDLFVFLCWTGQRYSDILSFNNGILNDDETMIEIIQQKRSSKVSIPLFPVTKAILNKYHNKLPEIKKNKVLSQIKIIGKMAGINKIQQIVEQRGSSRRSLKKKRYEMIGTHTARRSFITNMLKKGYDSHILMKITGHRSEESFKTYSKVTSEDAAKLILDKEKKNLGHETNQPLENRTININLLDYMFAEKTFLRLAKLQKAGADISVLDDFREAVAVVKDLSHLDKVKSSMTDTLINKVKSSGKLEVLENIIWDIAKRSADTTLYQIFEQKVIELKISDKINNVSATEVLDMIFQQEIDEERNRLGL